MKDGLELSKLSGTVKPKHHSMISRKESFKCASVRYSAEICLPVCCLAFTGQSHALDTC